LVLEFSDFELDVARFELRRGGEPVKIEPRPLEVLLYLAAHRDRVVGKTELIEKLWGVKFISESALTRCIHEARRALGDDGPEAAVIRTVHGRGYRFIAPVREREGVATAPESPGRERSGSASDTLGGGAPRGADEFAGARDPEAPAPVVSSRRRLRPWAVLWLASLALAVASGVVFLYGSRPGTVRPDAGNGGERLPALTQLTAGILDAVKPAYSPDGGSLLFASQTPEYPGLLDLFLMPAGGGEPRRLTVGAGASGDLPVFTADGSAIVFSRFRSGADGSRLPDLWGVSRFGGEPGLFLEGASGAGFSADGEWVAYTRHVRTRTPLWVSRTTALGEHRELAESGFVPRWSPGGEWVAYTTSNPQGGLGALWLVSPSSGERRQLTEERQQFYGLAWARDGRSLVYSARHGGFFQLFQVDVSGGFAAPLTSGISEHTSPTVAPDGKTLAFCHSQASYRLATVNGLFGPATTEITQPDHHLAPRLAPEGWRIASTIRRPDFDETLHVTDLVTLKQARLSDQRARQPSWLNGEEIAYLVAEPDESATDVWVVNSATDLRYRWTRLPGDASWLAVSPEKTSIAYVSHSAEGENRVVVREMSDRRERTVASGAEYECLRWRPGARMLSWSGPVDGGDPEGNGVWIADLRGGAPVRIAPDGYGPVWSGDGRSVYFTRLAEDLGLWRIDIDGRRLAKVREWHGVSSFDIAGDRLFYVLTSGRSQLFAMPLDQ
jgi:Tol biopolymer transport system component/DNA-binding winged helix-turn-helix (wHTH) protein